MRILTPAQRVPETPFSLSQDQSETFAGSIAVALNHLSVAGVELSILRNVHPYNNFSSPHTGPIVRQQQRVSDVPLSGTHRRIDHEKHVRTSILQTESVIRKRDILVSQLTQYYDSFRH